uniref:Superkiller complex protein 8 n=1 Tax=Oryctolagus cuniculus TaxID=9986 RepID=G1SWE5_RABIT
MTNQYSILFKQEQAHDDAIWSVAWGTNKKENTETVVTGSLDDLVKVWKWCDERLDLQWSLEGHQLGVVSVDISHTLPIAASSSLDAHIRLWDLENGKQIKSIDAGPVDAWTLAFSPDSQYLATGTHVGKVNIFGVESGKKEYSLDTRGKFILSIAYVRKLCLLLLLSGCVCRLLWPLAQTGQGSLGAAAGLWRLPAARWAWSPQEARLCLMGKA